MRWSSVLVAVLLFLGLLGVAGGLAAFKMREIQAASKAPAFEPMETVEIVEAGQASWQPTADLVGTVIAKRSVMVSNERAGVVTAVGFESGSIVEKGQVILAQDETSDRADLEAAKASVRVAEANVIEADARIALAERTLERMNTVEERAIAATERDRAEAELSGARAERTRWMAEVDHAKAQVSQVEARLAKLTIVAPFRARAGMRMVHEGQYLSEGSTVVSLQELTDDIFLDFAIPQEYAPRVVPGTAVMATGELLGPEPERIEVVAVDATVNNDTRNLRVRAVVDNSEGGLVPGMFIQIRVPVEAPMPYVMVPGTAVRRSSYADFVFVVEPDNAGALRVHQRFVKLGAAVDERVIVVEGLKPGEKVAATGSFKLREGVLVRPMQPGEAMNGVPGAGGDSPLSGEAEGAHSTESKPGEN